MAHGRCSKKRNESSLRQQSNWKDVGRLAVGIRRDRCGRILGILKKEGIEYQYFDTWRRENLDIEMQTVTPIT